MFMNNDKQKKKIFLILFTIVLLCFSVIFSVRFGSVNYSTSEIFKGIFVKNYDDEILKAILWDIRIPRILIAVMVGCNLSLAGVLLQAVMKNPLADPGLTGVSSGASVTALIVMILFPKTIFFMNFSAFIGGSIACAVVFTLAWKKGLKPIRVILSGVAINAILGSITGLMFILFSDEIQGVLSWLNGSLNGKNWRHVIGLFPYTIFGLIACLTLIRDANILQLGDNFAINLGIDIPKKRLKLCAFACFLTGISVANVGLIGFVGLIVPHIARLMIGSDHTYLIPFAATMGAIVLVIADTLSRTLFSPIEIPAGIVMAVIGVPFFLYLLRKVGD